MPRILVDAVYREAKRLGAKFSPPRQLPKSLKECPDFVAEFYRNIVWPKRRVFDAPGVGPIGFATISFSAPEPVPDDLEVPDADAMNLFAIGTRDGGNWILLVDGQDDNPSDPTIYEMDHETPDEGIEPLGRLSWLLTQLQLHSRKSD